MCHLIDGELFAVGIIDNLPSGLSSVYMLYDPKWEFFQPGTLGALREIEYVRNICNKGLDPNFKYYYMGLYF
jgi:arginine-tRNA-protein transferase